jgi:4a-hydroxytetrahydrobiopterin dehydratase
LAEAQNHHPDWHNCYNRVSIALWTHSAGGVTDEDFALAKAIQSIDSSSPMPPANTAARPPSQQLG